MINEKKRRLPPSVGTELKLAVSLSVPDMEDLTMDDFDFSCDFFTCRTDIRSFAKEEMARSEEEDEDGNTVISYIAVLDTTDMKPGMIRCRVTAYIADADCEDNIRTEIGDFLTGVQIYPAL